MPLVYEEDMSRGRGFEACVDHSSSQKVAMAACGSETQGEKGVHSLQSSPQEIVIPKHESEDVTMTDRGPIQRRSQGRLSDDMEELRPPSGRVTRLASKRQGKTVECWTQATIDGAKEDTMDVVAALRSLKSELKDKKDRLAASEVALEETKAQLKEHKEDLVKCRRLLQDSRRFNRQIRKTNSQLEKFLGASREELSKCKDDLFSLQGVAQTPDSTISKQFESVSQQILHWIDAEVATFDKAHPDAKPDYMFSVGADRYPKEFLQSYAEAGEHLVRYLVHHFLQKEVFGKRVFLFGLPEETAELLREAELKMAELDPPRDSVAIASWRSETLKALGKTTTWKHCCEQQALELNVTLFKKLSSCLPVFFSSIETRESFYNQVLLPAVEPANTIKMSTSEYTFSLPRFTLASRKPVTMETLRTCKMLDLQTRKHLKSDSAVLADENGVIGDFIMLLEPALRCVNRDKATVLHQGTVLVKLSHPLGKRLKPST